MTPERLRILFLQPGIAIGDPTGGAEAFLLRLAVKLDEGSFERAVFATYAYHTAAEAEWRSRLEKAGVHLFGMQASAGGWLNDFRAVLPGLWRTVQDYAPHIIVTSSDRLDFINLVLRIFHPKRPRAIRVVQLEKPWSTHPRVGLFLVNILFPLFYDLEIATSLSLQKFLLYRSITRWQKGVVPLVYNALEDDWFTQTMAHSLPDGMPAAGPRLGVVGRLTQQKGHRFLLQALPRILNHFSVQVVFVGVGELDGSLRSLARELGIQEYVHFLGARRDIASILSHLDVFVLPSLFEGFPAGILEAMACGTPVVATDVSGSRELVIHGQTGWLCAAGEVDQLAEMVIQVLQHPEAARLVAQQARSLVQRYSISASAKELGNLLLQVIRPGQV